MISPLCCCLADHNASVRPSVHSSVSGREFSQSNSPSGRAHQTVFSATGHARPTSTVRSSLHFHHQRAPFWAHASQRPANRLTDRSTYRPTLPTDQLTDRLTDRPNQSPVQPDRPTKSASLPAGRTDDWRQIYSSAPGVRSIFAREAQRVATRLSSTPYRWPPFSNINQQI